MSHQLRFGRKENHTKCLILVIFVAVLMTSIPVFGQLTEDDIAAMRERGKDEGWTFTVSLNPATQYSHEQLTGLVLPDNWEELGNFDPCIPSRDLPDSFDWRDYADLPPAKNQGGCGSCWAFATVGPLECLIRLKDDSMVDLSEQWLVSCNQNGYGCEGGGFVCHQYHVWQVDPCDSTGAVLESDFPYVESEVPCNCPYTHPYLGEYWNYIGSGGGTPSVSAMKQAIIEYGPISVSINATDAFEAYDDGVFNECVGGPTDHAVTLVGWDDNQGTSGVWFLRNSWGTYWGEDGYCRIEYGCNAVGYAASYIYYQPININATNNLGQIPLTVNFEADAPYDTVENCSWDFGDSQSGSGSTTSHVYTAPGLYTVDAAVTTSHKTFYRTIENIVAAHSDTLDVDEVEASPGDDVCLNIFAHNFLEVKDITIPISYDGPLDMVYDSFSTAGLRTDYFEDNKLLNWNPMGKKVAIKLNCSSTGSQPYLVPGTGAVVSVWFHIPSGSPEESNPVTLEGYGAWYPKFTTYTGNYDPTTTDGSVDPPHGCCVGTSVGNMDCVAGVVDMGDLTILIDHLFISLDPLCCVDEGDVDLSGQPEPLPADVDMGDLTVLIDHLFISLNPLPACP